jgi:site-specific DNA-cytosine methylase
MPEPNNHDLPLRIGSLFSGYGGLDLAVEPALDAETVWFSENNEPVARVFAHHWPDVPNLGDITTINWRTVEPVDVLCGGFPCQDVSTVGKRAGLAPGTRSGLWSHMAEAIDMLQPQLVVVENVRGLLSSPAIRPSMEGDDDDRRNPDTATPGGATLRNLEPDPWGLGDIATRPLRAAGAVLGDLADLRYDAQWIGLPASLVGAPHPRLRIFIIGDPKPLFRTPLATDPTRGGETLDQVKARRGTIALSHQIIDLALNGPAGSPARNSASETLFTLIEHIFAAGDATLTPSPDGNTSPGEKHHHPHF